MRLQEIEEEHSLQESHDYRLMQLARACLEMDTSFGKATHCGNSSRRSHRNQLVAARLNDDGLATCSLTFSL